MKDFVFTILTIIFLSLNLAAQNQQQPDFSTIKTEKGMAVFSNVSPQPFSFLVAGKNPSASQNDDGSLMIQTDGSGVLVYFVPTSLFLDKTKKLKEADILAAHRNFEISNYEKSLATKLNVDKVGVDLFKVHDLRKGTSEFAEISSTYWSFPASNPDIPNRLYFQNVLLGDVVLMLGAVFNKSTDVEKVRVSLKETFESITFLPPPPPKNKPKKKLPQRKAGKS